jgi:hypothetical protein
VSRAAIAPALLAASLAASLAGSAPARAEPPRPLRGDIGQSAAVALAATGAVTLGELVLKPRVGALPARWTDRAESGEDTLNALDRSAYRLRWSQPAVAARVSDIGLAVSSLSALGLSALTGLRAGERPADLGLDAAIVFESTAVAMALNQMTKLVARRERPCRHFAAAWPPPAPPLGPCGVDRFDDNLSSFSGHTTLAASSWVSGATVATLRGNALAPLLWGAGAFFTAATGYLRIAASKHYLSDVLVGVVLGGAVGVLLPITFHDRAAAPDVLPAAGPAPPSGPLGRAGGGMWSLSLPF